MIRLSALALSLASIILATPAVAQTATIKPATASADKLVAKRICRTSGTTGTRLGGKRICLTPAEWNDREATDRQWLDSAASIHRLPGASN